MKVISQYDLTSKLFKQSTSIQYDVTSKPPNLVTIINAVQQTQRHLNLRTERTRF